MLKRSSFHPSNVIQLKGVVRSESFEDSVVKVYLKENRAKPLLIDFREADFIELACLSNCIATLVQRTESGFLTYIGWPSKKTVSDFLKAWRFDEAITEALKGKFIEILLPEDLKQYEEEQTTYSGKGAGLSALEYDPEWNENPFARRNFFEFVTIKAERTNIEPSGTFLSTPRRESKRWAGELIKEVLRTHLGSDNPTDDIARVVVFEAISNAIRHPNAKLIQCASRFEPSDKEHYSDQVSEAGIKRLGTLRICIWDDGDSIASTLSKPVRLGKPIRAFNLPAYMYEKIFVQVRDYSKEKIIQQAIVDQSQNPVRNSSEARFLLSSLFPGVTRTLAHEVPDVEPFESSKKINSTQDHGLRGMGLYALTRTVLDQFQGSLLIKSGKYRLVLEVAHDVYRIEKNVRYKCKMTESPKGYPPFKGNLLVVQIPTK